MCREKKRLAWLLLISGTLIIIVVALMFSFSRTSAPPTGLSDTVGVAENGKYLARISGCIACHTDTKNGGDLLAGGAAIKTSFGEFYAPNITSDTAFGIGGWSLEDFYQALTAGVSPSGQHYYPAFPYPSYAQLSVSDIADIKAYLDTVAPVQKSSKPHALTWPFSMRSLMVAWKALFLPQNWAAPATSKMDRGEYLVRGPGHCAECHSQRNGFGAISNSSFLQGNTRGPEGHAVPALTGSNAEMQRWDKVDLVFYLQTGLRPDGDVAGGSMADVINEVTAYLDQDDAEAIADYLLNLP